MSSNNIAVSLVYHVCPSCLKKDGGSIIIPKKINLSKAKQKEFEEINHKVIGFGDLCEECTDFINRGYIHLIEIDPTKSDDMSNPYRTGKQVCIKKPTLDKIIDTSSIKHGMAFVEQGFLDKIGVTKEFLEGIKNQNSEPNQTDPE